MQKKLTFVFVFIGLSSCMVVGLSAYMFIVHEFGKHVEDEAFQRFKTDFIAYVEKYGNVEAAFQAEPFDLFVKQYHLTLPVSDMPMGLPKPPHRSANPPFRHLVADSDGIVLQNAGDFALGDRLPPDILETCEPIEVAGTVVYAKSVGDVNLTAEDEVYLLAVKRALINGAIISVACSLLLGLGFGQGLSRSLKQLTRAIRKLQESSEDMHHVSISSNDELGELAVAFNDMNTELSAAHRKLRELSIRDPLTNLYNRRYFSEQAKLQHDQAVRYGQSLSVMIGDLDHFKLINDMYSHEIGDKVLQAVAQIMENCTRQSDIVARFGGEEFVVLFPCTDKEAALVACEHIRESIEEYPWEDIHPGLAVTISIGLSDTTSSKNINRMLSYADGALYAAKDGGRNRVVPAGV